MTGGRWAKVVDGLDRHVFPAGEEHVLDRQCWCMPVGERIGAGVLWTHARTGPPTKRRRIEYWSRSH